jgi:hypothetical protein
MQENRAREKFTPASLILPSAHQISPSVVGPDIASHRSFRQCPAQGTYFSYPGMEKKYDNLDGWIINKDMNNCKNVHTF